MLRATRRPARHCECVHSKSDTSTTGGQKRYLKLFAGTLPKLVIGQIRGWEVKYVEFESVIPRDHQIEATLGQPCVVQGLVDEERPRGFTTQ